MSRFINPVLPGFNPDPSVCAVGEDYYLVTSTFAYFPGVPIYHSRDLVNWTQIGNVLDRESQVKLEGVGHSRGIFAPTLRYHDGVFYMITTNVSYGGNFIVTTTDVRGPWSDPHFLENAPGIDPSLFFDEDGKCYYTGTRPNPRGERYNGDWEVWLQELDLKTMKLIGVSTKLWKGSLRGAIWPEGPHLYKKEGYYYLMIAEGGTGDDHAITISRSENIAGPYTGNPKNPIVTHRHLGAEYHVQNVGHGDLVETPCGKWYMICLASRMYHKHSNLGRETFLAAVTWEKGWPVVNAGHGKLLAEQEHQLPLYPSEKKRRYDFKDGLDLSFLSLRTPQPDFYTIRDGKLYLKTLPESLQDLKTPAYLGLRQNSMFFTLATKMSFDPIHEAQEAGLVIIQSDTNQIRFIYVIVDGIKRLQVHKRFADDEDGLTMKSVDVDAETLYLKIKGHGQELAFYYSLEGETYYEVCAGVDARFLSTEAAGGFVGCTLGMYATSNGYLFDHCACFEWLDLRD